MYSKDEFYFIGRQLLKVDAVCAARLLDDVKKNTNVLCSDYESLNSVLYFFYSNMLLQVGYIEGDLKKNRYKSHLRRIFIAFVLRIYDPKMLIKSSQSVRLRRGLRPALAVLLNQHTERYVSEWVTDAVFEYNVRTGVYKAFSEKVDELYELAAESLFNKELTLTS